MVLSFDEMELPNSSVLSGRFWRPRLVALAIMTSLCFSVVFMPFLRKLTPTQFGQGLKVKNCIAKIRKEQGLTLQALADRVGASNQQISHLEKGCRGLTVDWLERIATGLECHPFDLVELHPSRIKTNGAAITVIEQKLVLQFRQFSDEQQEAMLNLLRTMVDGGSNPE